MWNFWSLLEADNNFSTLETNNYWIFWKESNIENKIIILKQIYVLKFQFCSFIDPLLYVKLRWKMFVLNAMDAPSLIRNEVAN